MILTDCSVCQGMYCTFILNLFDLFSHVAFTFSQSLGIRKSHFLTQFYTYRKTSCHTCRKTSSEITVFNIQKDFILSHQLIKL
jgi:hypothetical protein